MTCADPCYHPRSSRSGDCLCLDEARAQVHGGALLRCVTAAVGVEDLPRGAEEGDGGGGFARDPLLLPRAGLVIDALRTTSSGRPCLAAAFASPSGVVADGAGGSAAPPQGGLYAASASVRLLTALCGGCSACPEWRHHHLVLIAARAVRANEEARPTLHQSPVLTRAARA